MNDQNILDIPQVYTRLLEKSKEIGFSMPSDLYVGTFLKTLTTSKPKANLLEIGTGISLSLSWMIEGMDAHSRITSIDNDPKLAAIALDFFGNDPRVNIVCQDGTSWLKEYQGEKFDLIFADAWPGKYSEIEEVLALLKPGGLYILDDMLPQPNWPDGHAQNVNRLIEYLEQRQDLHLTKLNWSTGIVMAAKKA